MAPSPTGIAAIDTAALNASLLAAVQTGSWWILPKGTWKTNATVSPPAAFGPVNGLKIQGQGMGQSIIQFNPTSQFGAALGNSNNDNGWIF